MLVISCILISCMFVLESSRCLCHYRRIIIDSLQSILSFTFFLAFLSRCKELKNDKNTPNVPFTSFDGHFVYR